MKEICLFYANGKKEWRKNGKLQRVEYPDGDKYWYKDDELHRVDGPAVEWASGYKEWWKDGEYIKTCIPKTLTIQEDGIEKQVSICCIECVRFYKHISEDKFYKLSLLI